MIQRINIKKFYFGEKKNDGAYCETEGFKRR